MAQVRDVRSSSRDTSPDPITLPSSPLVAHSGRKTRSSVKPSPRKMNRRSATPSKSIILDTPKAGNDSPWRIKVTVEAEPRDGSPGKRVTRTTSVPLNDGDARRSSSPTKKRPARKRKGTPLRDTRPARQYQEAEPTTEEDDAVPQRSHSPARRASGRLARLSAQPGSARSKRLSYARDELDQALQNAVGYSDVGSRYDAPGDMTTSRNEDFSMVSMESLQSAKENSMAHVMQTIPEADKSTESVSYLPSSPPKVQYPNIERKAEKARSSLGKSVVSAYDPMSWKPTGPAKKSSPQSLRKQEARRVSNERQWQKQRESVSQQIQNTDAEDVVFLDDALDDAPEDHGQVVTDVNEDIWQDKASRSLEEDQGTRRSRREVADQRERSPQMEDLFAGQPLKPLRSKIPQTWRRSSGMDFSYVDSPAHQPPQEPDGEPEEEDEAEAEGESEEELEAQPAETENESRRHSTDGSGVLTPPSTEESEQSDQAADEGEEYEESEFEPDAEATRMQNVDEEDEAATPGSDGSASSPDGEDTGQFFQHNLPQVYLKERPRKRPPRQKTIDLTDLLNLDGANSPEKAAVTGSKSGAASSPKVRGAAPPRPPLQMQALDSKVNMQPQEKGKKKVLNSPLRKSLLRGSKMYGSPAAVTERRGTHMRYPEEPQRPEPSHPRSFWKHNVEPNDSFESKTSDQQQLLSEAAAEEEHNPHYEYDHDDDMVDDEPHSTYQQPYAESEELYDEDEEQQQEVDAEQEEYYEEEEEVPVDQNQSYEERLNLDSPQKIQVNFNDSKIPSSLLANRQPLPTLFDRPNAPRYPHAAERSFESTASSDEIILVAKKPQPEPSQPGFLSRLSTTFWNAITGPPPISPPTQEECEAYFYPSLRTQIRSRYGVVSEEFPWTFAQMRTLQRMLNSLTSNRPDSIIPNTGPLPLYLENLINTYQKDIAGFDFVFEEPHAYVMLSFFQVTVSRHLVEAMRRGEVEPLGDSLSRGIQAQGNEVVFKEELHGKKVADWVNSHRGIVGMKFVIRALGTCVNHNKDLERKWGLSFEELQKRNLVGKEPPEDWWEES